MHFTKAAKRNISLTLLAFILFSFLHSEIGFLDYDHSSHESHDYCEIVKNTNTQVKVIREKLIKPEPQKDICLHCDRADVSISSLSFLEKSSPNFPSGAPEKAYLYNSVLLI